MSTYLPHVCILCAVMALGFLWEWKGFANPPAVAKPPLRPMCKCPNCAMWNEADYDDTDGKCWVCGENIDKAIEAATAIEPPGKVKVTLKAENKLTFPGVTGQVPQVGDVTPLGVINSMNVECDVGGDARVTVEYV